MGLLELKNVEYKYKNPKNTKALSNITYTFEKGRFYVIMGSSGSGKTTCLSLLAGLDNPTEGEICFNGMSLKLLDRSNYRINNTAVIYQNFNLFSHLNVVENVMFPLDYKNGNNKENVQTAKKSLEMVGIKKELYYKSPKKLSGGEQQRVTIARAIANQSEIILADEPTGSLDGMNRDNIIKLFLELAHERECCVIVVTHDNEVAKLADKIIYLENGKIINN